MPTMSSNGDSTLLKYKSLGSNVTMLSAAGAITARWYIPGNTFSCSGTAGQQVAGFYATGVFRPGTYLRWEPTVSPTLGGRGFVGFTDNPEIIVDIGTLWSAYQTTKTAADYVAYSAAVKGLANVVSFPMWAEWEGQVPTRLRRKRFDSNETATFLNVDVMDRSCQVAMFACFDGTSAATDAGIGSFWYHDVIDVEGLHSQAT